MTKQPIQKIPKRLPKVFKNKWIEALRSGHYIQGTSALAISRVSKTGKELTPSYCCLGVACHLVGISDEALLEKSMPSELLKTGRLPKLLLRNDDVLDTLTNMNDTEGKSFRKIASWIEENL